MLELTTSKVRPTAKNSKKGRELGQIRMLLTLEVEVDVCVAVPELVEGVAPVHAAVLQARVLDGQRENVLVLLQRTAPAIDMIQGL